MLTNTVYAQSQAEPFIKKVVQAVPDLATRSTQILANYLHKELPVTTDFVRGAFLWIAKTISYDIQLQSKKYTSTQALIDYTIQSRRAICQGYAEVLNDLCHKAGIQSYVINGYTKQSGSVDTTSGHAWVTVLIDNEWRFFDPTWGSGYLQNGKYYQQINEQYYSATPTFFIKDHMPFDPLWQFLEYPLTYQAFSEHKLLPIPIEKTFFNYKDSLKRYEQQSESGQLRDIIYRIEHNGIPNALILQQVGFHKYNLQINHYNEAKDLYNAGIAKFNTYIDFKNHMFRPKIEDKSIQQMITEINLKISESKWLASLAFDKANDFNDTVIILNNLLEEVNNRLQAEQQFLTQYVKTWRPLRGFLFYQK